MDNQPEYIPDRARANPFAQRQSQVSAAETLLGRRIVYYLAVVLAGVTLGFVAAHASLLLMLGIVGGASCVVVIALRPFVGLLLYAALFILRLGELYPAIAALRLERVIGAVTLGSIFLNQFLREGRLYLDRSEQTKRLLFFLIAVLLSVPFAHWRKAAVDGVVEMLRIAVFYVMVIHLLDTRRKIRLFICVLCFLIAYTTLTSLMYYYTGERFVAPGGNTKGRFVAQGIDRAVGNTSFSRNPNEFGATVACTLPLLFTAAGLGGLRVANRFLLGTTALLMALTMMYTGSRSALLGFLAGVLVLCSKSRHKVPMGILVVLLCAAGFAILPDQYKSRYETTLQTRGTGHARIEIWKDGLGIFLSRPLCGVGIGNFETAHFSRDGLWLNSHSLYIQVLAELGIVGTIAFFGFLLEVIRVIRRTTRRLALGSSDWSFEKAMLNGLLAGLVVLLVTGIFGHSLMRRTWYVYGAVGLSIARVHQRQEEFEEENQNFKNYLRPSAGHPA